MPLHERDAPAIGIRSPLGRFTTVQGREKLPVEECAGFCSANHEARLNVQHQHFTQPIQKISLLVLAESEILRAQDVHRESLLRCVAACTMKQVRVCISVVAGRSISPV